MTVKYAIVPILLVFLIVSGCVSPTGTGGTPTTTTTIPPTITTPQPPVTTPLPAAMVEGDKTIQRDAFDSWEVSLIAGQRIAVDVVTDGAPVDLLVLDLSNYYQFSTAFTSRSGALWESYVILKPDVIRQREEFKAPRSGKYRIIIENADVIPGGAVTTRAVNVVIRAYSLD